jgi:CheY-like chemotaxis protein
MLGGAFQVVAAVSDGRQAMSAVLDLDPDLLITDLSMPYLDGLQLAHGLKKASCWTKIIMLTMHSDRALINAALDLGVLGYVLQARLSLDIVSAVDKVLKGNSFVSDLAGSKKTSEGKPGPTIGHALASTSFFDKENSRVLPAPRPIKRIALRTYVYRPHGRREEPITQINPHRRLKVSRFRSMKRLDGAFSHLAQLMVPKLPRRGALASGAPRSRFCRRSAGWVQCVRATPKQQADDDALQP